VRVDETGLGRKLAADLMNVHGALIEPITFTVHNKEEMALNLKGLMERERLWLQHENERIKGQIHNIKRKRTASGNLQYSGEPHDDMFWALALACKGNARRGGFRILTLDV
jgi:phage FluMu gp28-like protein